MARSRFRQLARVTAAATITAGLLMLLSIGMSMGLALAQPPGAAKVDLIYGGTGGNDPVDVGDVYYWLSGSSLLVEGHVGTTPADACQGQSDPYQLYLATSWLKLSTDPNGANADVLHHHFGPDSQVTVDDVYSVDLSQLDLLGATTVYFNYNANFTPHGQPDACNFNDAFAGGHQNWNPVDMPTSTPTETPAPPTSTPTATDMPPTATETATPEPPTATPTATEVPPASTPTTTSTATPTSTATATPTATGVPSTATATTTATPTLTPTTSVPSATATTAPATSTATPSATAAPGVSDTATPAPTSAPAENTATPRPASAPAEITATPTATVATAAPVVAAVAVSQTQVAATSAVSLPRAGDPAPWPLAVVGVCLVACGFALRRIANRLSGASEVR